MQNKTPYDLFIECRSCGVENNIPDYVPSMRIFCSQCRERLIDVDIVETHCEYICQACDMRLVLLHATEVKSGESACSCGSTDVLKIGKTSSAVIHTLQRSLLCSDPYSAASYPHMTKNGPQNG